MRTLVDTTSLIALAMADSKNFDSGIHSWDELSAGVESLLLYDEILIDDISFERNVQRFPSLSELRDVCNPINNSEALESECYSLAASVLAPLLGHSGDWLVHALRRHLDAIDTVELSVCKESFYPSTYWEDLAPRLSESEKELVLALERVLRSNTPFSRAALTSLVRLFYYLVAQELYQCSVALHPTKSSFLAGIDDFEARHADTVYRVPKTIIDAFDSELRNNFDSEQRRWLGGNDLIFSPPLLVEYVFRKVSKKKGLIPTLLLLRDSEEAKEYRTGVMALVQHVSRSETSEVSRILADLNEMSRSWQNNLQSRKGRAMTRVRVGIPFVRGLGDAIASLIPKRAPTPSERIFTFLHLISEA